MKVINLIILTFIITGCSVVSTNREIASDLNDIYHNGHIKLTVVKYDIGEAKDTDYKNKYAIGGGSGVPEFSIMFDKILDRSNDDTDERKRRLASDLRYLWYSRITKDSDSFTITIRELKKMMSNAIRDGKKIENGNILLKLAEADWRMSEIPIPSREFSYQTVKSDNVINIGDLINGSVLPINIQDPVNGLHIQLSAEFINE
jgi:hypothetical protein